MVALLSFHYRPGDNALHRSSASLKLLMYLVANIELVFLSAPAAAVLIGIQLVVLRVLHVKLAVLAKELRALGWILLLTYISKAHLSGGERFVLGLPEPFSPISFSWNKTGALSTLGLALKLSSAVASTQILLSSTTLAELQKGIYGLLRPFGVNFAWKSSSMLRIMLSSLTYFLDRSKQADQTLKVRGLIPKKQPVTYLRAMSSSMLNTLDELGTSYAKALIIRGWSDEPMSKDDMSLSCASIEEKTERLRANRHVILWSTIALILPQTLFFLLP